MNMGKEMIFLISIQAEVSDETAEDAMEDEKWTSIHTTTFVYDDWGDV